MSNNKRRPATLRPSALESGAIDCSIAHPWYHRRASVDLEAVHNGVQPAYYEAMAIRSTSEKVFIDAIYNMIHQFGRLASLTPCVRRYLAIR